MIGDQLCPSSWRASPGSFVGLMTLYESNYIRLRGLLGSAPEASDLGVASIPGDARLAFQVLERGPYTTLMRISYEAVDARGRPAPAIRVRVYHDARVVEATGVEVEREATAMLPVDGEGLAPRWARNMLLNKWLEYCRDRGYRFDAA